ncbi:MAG TPA: B12-binding domain-containing radical SAM protein, partial [Candidatus Mediterraneibacter stercoravium]|nr:B12-binding domain-containing radical SAM protein [Candidatus Mediterraneibacter stercoravium]
MRKLALDDEILLNIEKPARYIGGEVNSVMKDKDKVDIRFAMCFPDVYEIGMSHLGIQILYDMFNRREDTWCERVYSPWMDLDKILREKNIPLFALESQDPVRNFDFLGITIQFEMCYTNILQILDLSQIPLHASDRTEEDPFVIGGGPCTYNPEPLAEFFDIFYIGEGETVYDELLDAYREWKKTGGSRKDFLRQAAQIEGLYVPQFYNVTYHEDGTIESFLPNDPSAPERIRKQVVMEVTDAPYPMKPVVPFIKATQDRVVLEIQRG